MTKIKVGTTIHPQHCTMAQLREAWLRAEDLGVDSLWTWDHFFPLYGEPDGPHFQGYPILAAMAASTTKPTIGMLVTCNSYRNPNYLADIARTVDHISEGRHILGIGSGWFERDYDEYGYEFGTAPERLKALDRDLPIIIDRLGKLNPGPVNGKLPIMVGGSGPKVTLRITAQYADLWNGGGTPEEYKAKNDILNEWCYKLGRDPKTVERTASRGETDVADLADDYVKAGADHILTVLRAPDFDTAHLKRLVEWRNAVNG